MGTRSLSCGSGSEFLRLRWWYPTSQCLLMYLGEQQMMAQVPGSLPPTWETLMVFQAPTLGLMQPWLLCHSRNESTNEGPFLSLCLSNKINKSYKKEAGTSRRSLDLETLPLKGVKEVPMGSLSSCEEELLLEQVLSPDLCWASCFVMSSLPPAGAPAIVMASWSPHQSQAHAGALPLDLQNCESDEPLFLLKLT